MNISKIMNLIDKGLQVGDFTGKVDTSKINQLEITLEVGLPESYKWFIENYGHGGIGGLEILGIAKSEIPTCLNETERYRKLGLPTSYVVVENCDELVYCLDTSKVNEGECPVVYWNRTGKIGLRYENFEEYICDRLLTALERMGIE